MSEVLLCILYVYVDSITFGSAHIMCLYLLLHLRQFLVNPGDTITSAIVYQEQNNSYNTITTVRDEFTFVTNYKLVQPDNETTVYFVVEQPLPPSFFEGGQPNCDVYPNAKAAMITFEDIVVEVDYEVVKKEELVWEVTNGARDWCNATASVSKNRKTIEFTWDYNKTSVSQLVDKEELLLLLLLLKLAFLDYLHDSIWKSSSTTVWSGDSWDNIKDAPVEIEKNSASDTADDGAVLIGQLLVMLNSVGVGGVRRRRRSLEAVNVNGIKAKFMKRIQSTFNGRRDLEMMLGAGVGMMGAFQEILNDSKNLFESEDMEAVEAKLKSMLSE
jgi:hypothetical protein